MTSSLRAGAAETVITPPLGVSIFGAYHDERAAKVLSDLHAHALVLEDGTTQAAIVTLDICAIRSDLGNPIAERVQELTGIPCSHVMLTCTHTHSGPAAYPTPWYGPDHEYLSVMIRRVADAVVTAHQRLVPACLLAGRGAESTVSFNRRFWMRDGTLRTNPPYQSPDIVRVAGPIDPEVLVLRVEDLQGAPLALLVNFAMHPAMVGGLDFVDGPVISADFPGAMASVLKQAIGQDVAVLFANGTCGNINHRDRSKPGPQAGQAVANWIGAVLAGEVIKIGARLEPVADDDQLQFTSRVVDLELRIPTEEEVAWARDFTRAEMYEMDAAGMEIVRAHRILGLAEAKRTTSPVEVQALSIGSFAYVTFPSELFVEFGLDLKRRSPFPYTLISELNSSSSVSYIPTKEAYPEGGYESESASVVPGSGERLVDIALELLHSQRALV
jgi:neutral ceramidase